MSFMSTNQPDKEAVFDAAETAEKSLAVFAPMVKTMRPIKENMYAACRKGFINATDLADYLAKKGMPFRAAYKTTGELVGACVKKGVTLGEVPLEEYKKHSPLFEDDLYEAISIENCVKKRISEGSAGYASVKKQLAFVKEFLQ